MLNGKELGQAIEAAYKMKKATGAISSKADVARHFGIKTPSVYDWVKKGSISKDKLPELWSYFSDVAGPEHWGLSEWPCTQKQGAAYAQKDQRSQQHEVREPPSPPWRGKEVADRYLSAGDATRAAVDLILLPNGERALLNDGLRLAIKMLEDGAKEALLERKNDAAAA
jgi:hypothetical protein